MRTVFLVCGAVDQAFVRIAAQATPTGAISSPAVFAALSTRSRSSGVQP
jgi:hypothetical protein